MVKLIFSALIFINGCTTISTKTDMNVIFKDKYHYGTLNESLIKNHSGYPWFNKQYEKYIPKVQKIDKNLLNQITIKIFMGTWCHDSKREVPRFYKILNTLNYDQTNLQIVGLNKDKKGYFNDYSYLNIKNTPTFIFFKNDKEIGRIIERPKGSLELQIQNILEKV
jgi:thiol-disulfide isomerase/thioredoxin